MATVSKTPRALASSRSSSSLSSAYRLYNAPGGSATALLRAEKGARGRPASAGRVPLTARHSGSGRLPTGVGPARAISPSAYPFHPGERERRLREAAMSPGAIDDLLERPSAPLQKDAHHGSLNHDTSAWKTHSIHPTISPYFDENASDTSSCRLRRESDDVSMALDMSVHDQAHSSRTGSARSSSKALLQEQVLRLKAELNEGVAEVKRYRQKLVHLEGDLQGKKQWMIQWERQVAAKEIERSERNPLEREDYGLNGLGWSAWSTFVDRGVKEAEKTQRLLSRSVNIEWYRATHDELQEWLQIEESKLHEQEGLLRSEEAENSRVSIDLRKLDARSSLSMKTAEMYKMEAKLASRQTELRRFRANEVEQGKEQRRLRDELQDQEIILSNTPAQQMKRKVQQAMQRSRDECEAEENSEQEAFQQFLHTEFEHSLELRRLEGEFTHMENSHAETNSELEELERHHEVAMQVARLERDAKSGVKKAAHLDWEVEALQEHMERERAAACTIQAWRRRRMDRRTIET